MASLSMMYQKLHLHLFRASWSKIKRLKIAQASSRNLSAREQSSRPFSDGDRSLLDFSREAEEDSWSFSVIPNFVTEEDEANLMRDINRTLRGKKYQFDHWDGAIEGYRETEKSQWLEINHTVIARLKKVTSSALKGKSLDPLPDVHVLDLAQEGHIKPHVDSIKFCGDVIASISLLSQSVMRLQHEDESDKWICALLPQHSVYIMRGVTRYKYTHAIPPNEESVFKTNHVTKERRVSVICRTSPTSSVHVK